MAFRLRPDESARHGLRRVAKRELRSARDRLRESSPPSDETIHEARKALKKVRAIADLIAADGGRLGGSPKRLRKIGRTLSNLRDADAMLETLKQLMRKQPDMLSEHALARARRQLSLRKAAALMAAQEHGAWEAIDRDLRNLQRAAKQWRTGHRDFGAFTGIRAAYRRGQKAMARARTRQRAEDFHDWRKQVKALWYQLRLLDAWAPQVRKDIRQLDQIETWLGTDHNVVVLCAALSKDRSVPGVDRLERVAARYQAELRRKALARAKRLYAEKPRDYLRRLKRAVDAGKRRRAGGDQARSGRAA